MNFLEIHQGTSPLIVSIPHTGLEIPHEIEAKLVSPWLSRKDADWHIEKLYGFARELGATLIRTTISRTVIDVNRDPSGVTLYPGQATTGLCPLTTFDGEALYLQGQEPSEAEINQRKAQYFTPYHTAIEAQITRLKRTHKEIYLYDCHSIRSHIPRLFEGELPHFNLGTNEGKSCNIEITHTIERILAATGLSHVTNGRFKGGYITRHYGRPHEHIHAIQMELSCRAYMQDPLEVNAATWPTAFKADYNPKLNTALREIFMYLSALTAQ